MPTVAAEATATDEMSLVTRRAWLRSASALPVTARAGTPPGTSTRAAAPAPSVSTIAICRVNGPAGAGGTASSPGRVCTVTRSGRPVYWAVTAAVRSSAVADSAGVGSAGSDSSSDSRIGGRKSATTAGGVGAPV